MAPLLSAGPGWRLLRLLALVLAQLPALLAGPEPRATALVRVLEDMGGAWVKLGQLLATRRDIVDDITAQALAGLFDRVTPAPATAVAATLSDAWGQPPTAVLDSFDPDPVAAGAIAQVHRARIDGKAVAIKVRRPGLIVAVATDVWLMRRLARLLSRFGADPGGTVPALVEAFAAMLESEIDFAGEAAAMVALGALLPPGARTPTVITTLSGSDVLVMEWIDGVALGRLTACPPDLPWRLAMACVVQFYVTGVFHGDPHPGNVLLADDGSLVFVDCGLHGRLAAPDVDCMGRYMAALAAGRTGAAMAALTPALRIGPGADPAAFRRAAMRVLGRWRRVTADPALPAAQRGAGRFQQELMKAMRQTQVRIDDRFTLFWRAQAMLDATMLALPVDVDLAALLRDALAAARPELAAPRLQPLLAAPRPVPPLPRPTMPRPAPQAFPLAPAVAAAAAALLLVAATAVP